MGVPNTEHWNLVSRVTCYLLKFLRNYTYVSWKIYRTSYDRLMLIPSKLRELRSKLSQFWKSSCSWKMIPWFKGVLNFDCLSNVDVPEWLSGMTRNHVGFDRVGSNPAVHGFSLIFFLASQEDLRSSRLWEHIHVSATWYTTFVAMDSPTMSFSSGPCWYFIWFETINS